MDEKDLIERLELAAKKTRKSLDEHLEDSNVTKSAINSISREDLIAVLKSISSNGAYLNKPSIDLIIRTAGFAKIDDEEDKYFKKIWESNPPRGLKVQPVLDSGNEELISELRKTIFHLSSKIDNLPEMGASNDKQDIEEIKKLITDASSSSKKISAPIKLPTPKDMEIRLVSADSLERMNEYQNDINIFLSLASVFLGAFLGIIINYLFLSTSIKAPVIGMASVLLICSAVFFGLFKRNNKRSKELRDAFFSNDSGGDANDYFNERE